MTNLIECTSCRGLKRADSERCPHCQTPTPPGLLKRALTAASLGLVATCGQNQNQYPADAYGAPCFADQDSGVCVPYAPRVDSGSYTYMSDAYGMVDAFYSTPMDAFGVPPMDLDSGTPPNDGGLRDGGKDGGPTDAGK